MNERKAKKLLEFSREHLIYELWMFENLAKVLIEKRTMIASDNAELARTVNFAIIESFVIHSRNLMDFFYRERVNRKERRVKRDRKGKRKISGEDDAFASDYFEDSGSWASVRVPDETGLLDKIRIRANKEVTHMTLKRLEVVAEEKNWDKIAEQYFKFISRTLAVFVQKASPEYLANEVVTFSRSLNPVKSISE